MEGLLHHELRGDGEPLLLLHGLTGSAADWAHVFDLEALARDWRLILPDARGHGRTGRAPEAISQRGSAADVRALLDALGIAQCRAIGMSYGGNTLLHVATMQPARIAAMVLVSATPYFPAAARAIMAAQADPRPRALAALPDDHVLTPPELAAITAETLIVAGDRDPLYPVELAVELYRAIPGAQLWVVPGGGHGPIFGADRAEFVERAARFLRVTS